MFLDLKKNYEKEFSNFIGINLFIYSLKFLKLDDYWKKQKWFLYIYAKCYETRYF